MLAARSGWLRLRCQGNKRPSRCIFCGRHARQAARAARIIFDARDPQLISEAVCVLAASWRRRRSGRVVSKTVGNVGFSLSDRAPEERDWRDTSRDYRPTVGLQMPGSRKPEPDRLSERTSWGLPPRNSRSAARPSLAGSRTAILSPGPLRGEALRGSFRNAPPFLFALDRRTYSRWLCREGGRLLCFGPWTLCMRLLRTLPLRASRMSTASARDAA